MSFKAPSTLRRIAAVVALAAAASVTANAQANTFVLGTAVNSPTLAGSATLGNEMVGMLVTWNFAGGGGTFSSAWGDLGGGRFGVVGANNFSLSMGATSNTFGDNWSLQNSAVSRLSSIRLNGAPGRTLFDCDWTGTACNINGSAGGFFGTSGSSDGWSLQTAAGGTYGGGVTGQYANAVGINGNAPVGDLFEQLTISFDGILGANATYNFKADTDNSSFNQPPPTVTPEPSTWALMFVGLTAVGVAKRRRRSR